MGLRDAFKSRRSARDSEDQEETIGDSDVTEPDTLAPEYNGTYRGRAVDEIPATEAEPAVISSTTSDPVLRFAPGGRVYFAPPGTPAEQLAGMLSPQNPEPWVGDYTGAGRFTVQRRFERPVIHTVLETLSDGFIARCTTTATGVSANLRYTFVPDNAGQAS